MRLQRTENVFLPVVYFLNFPSINRYYMCHQKNNPVLCKKNKYWGRGRVSGVEVRGGGNVTRREWSCEDHILGCDLEKLNKGASLFSFLQIPEKFVFRNKSTQFSFLYFIFLFIWFWIIPGSTRGWLLVMLRGPYRVLELEPRSAACKTLALPWYMMVPAPHSAFF